MAEKYVSGKITFIHHEKNRAVIEYEENGKKKTIQGDISDKAQLKLVETKIIKKPHRFLIGDHLKFIVQRTGSNGKILYADNIVYQYNAALEQLINRSAIENRFLGYVKLSDGKYFIKEIDTYLFFPLKIFAYELAPTEEEMEKPVTFKLENISRPDKIVATLYNHHYIPEFPIAVQHFKKQAVIQAVITKISAYGIYLELFNGKIDAKLPLDATFSQQVEENSLKVGDKINILIRHICSDRIIVEAAP